MPRLFRIKVMPEGITYTWRLGRFKVLLDIMYHFIHTWPEDTLARINQKTP